MKSKVYLLKYKLAELVEKQSLPEVLDRLAENLWEEVELLKANNEGISGEAELSFNDLWKEIEELVADLEKVTSRALLVEQLKQEYELLPKNKHQPSGEKSINRVLTGA